MTIEDLSNLISSLSLDELENDAINVLSNGLAQTNSKRKLKPLQYRKKVEMPKPLQPVYTVPDDVAVRELEVAELLIEMRNKPPADDFTQAKDAKRKIGENI
ncbi:hypothetical protein HDV06_001215 [Boothiomyces sp. JEL0866]|nr:hypothetical protein HDV06_001215 [Boothiomyces sp. JEL0866]